MRRALRFLAGATVGLAALGGYLLLIGAETVFARLSAVAGWAVVVVAVLVVAEGIADSLGVWASVEPLGQGLSPLRSVQFALAGDFFDVLSPAGPVSSEPIMARFIGVETETSYSEALAVRGVAKYVKSGAQLAVATFAGVALALGGTSTGVLVPSLGGAGVGLLLVGAVVVRWRAPITGGAVTVTTPVVRRLSSLYRDPPHDRSTVVAAFERLWGRVAEFRDRPGLLGLVALGGALEQVLTAAALWVALAGLGSPVSFVALVVVVPLPQVASVAPIPGSLGAYDVLLGGAVALVTGVDPAAAAAAVLLVRTLTLPFKLGVGGLAVAFLRGWRPS